MARSNRRKKKSPVGFWVLEAIVVIGFAALLMNAREIRESAGMESSDVNGQVSFVESDANGNQREASSPNDWEQNGWEQNGWEKNGWENHRPRFSQVVGELWSNGF